MKRFILIPLVALGALNVGCSDKNKLSSDEIHYVRLSASLMRLKATLPPTADSTIIQPKLDSVFKSFSMTRDQYVEFSQSLAANPDHTTIIYNAIKDSLGLH